MNERLPKPVKRALRELVGKAHEAELRRELDKVSADFERWKRGEIDSFELNERIHKHHNGPSREIFNRWTSNLDPDVLVAIAIRRGLLASDDVPEHARPYVEDKLEALRRVYGQPGEEG